MCPYKKFDFREEEEDKKLGCRKASMKKILTGFGDRKPKYMFLILKLGQRFYGSEHLKKKKKVCVLNIVCFHFISYWYI